MKMRWFVAVVALVFLVPQTLWAQPLADKVPGDALVYIGWSGPLSALPGYQDSHTKALLEASNIRQVFDQAVPQLLHRLARQPGNAQMGALLSIEASLLPVLQSVTQHPGAFYFGGLDFSGPQPMPRMALLCQAGADGPALQQQITALLAKAPLPPGMVQVTLANDLLMVSVGQPALAGGSAPAPGAPGANPTTPLAASPRFRAAAANLHRDPFRIGYIDVQGLLTLIDQAITRQNDDQARAQWPKVRDALGLAGIHQVAWSVGFEGRDFGAIAFIDAPAPRSGILGLFENGSIDDQALAMIPRSAATATVLRFDLAKVLPLIRQIAAAANPDAAAQFDNSMARASAIAGCDIQKDLLASLGAQWVLYTDRDVTGTGIWGTACISRLRDPPKAQQALAHLETAFNTMGARAAGQQISVRAKTTIVDGTTIHYLALPVLAPAWAIKDGNLYLGLHPQTVAGAMDRATAGGPSILDNPQFAALRTRLGGAGPAQVSYIDEPQLIGENYQFILLLSQTYLGAIDLMGVDIPPLVLPPLAKLLPHVGTAGGTAWCDDAGWHLHSVEPFPGSTLLTAPGAAIGPAGAALAAGIVVPALGAARTAANAMKSSSQVRAILTAAIMWSDANSQDASLPPDLATLVIDPKGIDPLAPKILISPFSKEQVPPDFDDWESGRKVQWVKDYSSYIYLGAGKKNDTNPGAILIYEKPEYAHRGMIVVGFGDSHVEVMPVKEALRRIGAQEGRPAGAPQ